MIGNARRIRSGHIQRKNYFYFGVQKRLWAFLNPIFTGGATLSVTPYGVPDSPFCRYATSVPLFVTYGDISPRPGRICPGRGKSFLEGGAFKHLTVCSK